MNFPLTNDSQGIYSLVNRQVGVFQYNLGKLISLLPTLREYIPLVNRRICAVQYNLGTDWPQCTWIIIILPHLGFESCTLQIRSSSRDDVAWMRMNTGRGPLFRMCVTGNKGFICVENWQQVFSMTQYCSRTYSILLTKRKADLQCYSFIMRVKCCSYMHIVPFSLPKLEVLVPFTRFRQFAVTRYISPVSL
jgi:hypothetical protein